MIQSELNYKGELVFDSSKPDGNPRKLLDSSLIKEKGWNPETDFKKGLSITVNWFKENII